MQKNKNANFNFIDFYLNLFLFNTFFFGRLQGIVETETYLITYCIGRLLVVPGRLLVVLGTSSGTGCISSHWYYILHG